MTDDDRALALASDLVNREVGSISMKPKEIKIDIV